jgi:hypothetical protein
MELKHDATGLGWDDARKTVDCDEAWWKEHLASEQCSVSGQYRPLHLLERFLSDVV